MFSFKPDCEKSSTPVVTESSASCGEQSGCSQECKIEDGHAVSSFHFYLSRVCDC